MRHAWYWLGAGVWSRSDKNIDAGAIQIVKGERDSRAWVAPSARRKL